MKSLPAGRLTRRCSRPATMLGAVVIAVVGAVLWAGMAGAASGSHPLVGARQRATAGTPGGIVTIRQGNMDMAMTRLSGKAPTWAELQRVYAMVQRGATAMAKYHTLAAARRDGYVTAPDLLVDGQGAHYFSPHYDLTAGFDPTHPAFLVYNPVHGNQVLSGLMYYVSGSRTPAQLATIFPASMASWHKHINVCITGGISLLNGKAILPYFDQASCVAHKGIFTGDTGWMVHTWIGPANGAGLFDMDMPTPSATSAMGTMPGM